MRRAKNEMPEDYQGEAGSGRTKGENRMSGDLISKKDAIKAVCVADCGGLRCLDKPYSCNAVKALKALSSAELTKGELISRADAIEAVVCHIWHTPPETRKLFNCENYVRDVVEEALKALPAAELILQTPQTYGKSINPSNAEVVADYISRADAIDAVQKELVCDGRHETHDKTCRFIADVLLSALPSADAVHIEVYRDLYEKYVELKHASAEAKPTVIRSKALLPTEDFKEWARRIREENPNVIVIPCDAEVASAEDVQGEWIFRTDIPIGGGRESAGYVCSKCRKDYFHVDGMNYCPNCGARMKRR